MSLGGRVLAYKRVWDPRFTLSTEKVFSSGQTSFLWLHQPGCGVHIASGRKPTILLVLRNHGMFLCTHNSLSTDYLRPLCSPMLPASFSPFWVVNLKTQLSSVDSSSIQERVCEAWATQASAKGTCMLLFTFKWQVGPPVIPGSTRQGNASLKRAMNNDTQKQKAYSQGKVRNTDIPIADKKQKQNKTNFVGNKKYSQVTKGAGNAAHVTACLPRMKRVLSSVLSTTESECGCAHLSS